MIRFATQPKVISTKTFRMPLIKVNPTVITNWLEEHKSFYTITTSKIVCKINKQNAKVSIFDLEGFQILDDEIGFHWEESYEFGGNIVKMSKKANVECYYGMGDKATHLNLKGKRVENWATDQYAFHREQEPLYKVVPFYIGLHHNNAYGIFFDNTFRTFFDFCHERRNVTSF